MVGGGLGCWVEDVSEWDGGDDCQAEDLICWDGEHLPLVVSSWNPCGRK